MEDALTSKKTYHRPPLSPTKPSLSPVTPPRTMCGVQRTEETQGGQKPSFIMDWLERINVDHLDFARFLKTPDREGKKTKSIPPGDLSPGVQASEECPSTAPPLGPSQTPNVKDTIELSSQEGRASKSSIRKLNLSPSIHSFRKQSIMMGNGWNAKGLQKAQEGNWEKALSCWENALEIRQQVLGPQHSDVANTWNNIGIALGKLERFPEALVAMQKALELRISQHGTEKHTEIAATYHNLANIHQQAENYHEALKLLACSMSISQSLLGKKDIQVARTRMAMGHAHFDAGEYLEARVAYREALGIMELCHRAGDRGGLDCSIEIDQCHRDIEETERFLLTSGGINVRGKEKP